LPNNTAAASNAPAVKGFALARCHFLWLGRPEAPRYLAPYLYRRLAPFAGVLGRAAPIGFRLAAGTFCGRATRFLPTLWSGSADSRRHRRGSLTCHAGCRDPGWVAGQSQPFPHAKAAAERILVVACSAAWGH
jgi:hypothetical protein